MTIEGTFIGPVIRFLWGIMKLVPTSYKKVINLCKRPKIDVSIRNLEIKFVTADGTEHFLSYIGLDFLNNEESALEININGIFINREKYINLNGINIIGGAAYISQENKTRWPCWESCNNDVFSAMKENWRDICQK